MASPTEQPVRKNFFRGIVKGAARAAGIETVPSVVAVDTAVQPQAGFVQPQIPSAYENAFQNAPEGALDPTKPAPSVATETPSNITVEPPTIVPAEPVAQAPVTEVSMESMVTASKPPEEPSPPPSPVDQEEVVEKPLETTEPIISAPSQEEPVARTEPPVFEEKATQAPAEPTIPNMDFNKPKNTEEAVPEDLIATEVVRDYSEKFIHDGVLDMKGLQAAIEEARIAKNPQAQKAVSQLHSIGVVNPEVISKVLKPILTRVA